MELVPLIARVAISLACVLGLIFVLQRAAKRRAGGRTVDASRFTVVARQSLSRSAGVTVLRLGEEALVVGVTDSSVQLLARVPIDTITGETVATEASAVRTEVRSEVALPPTGFTPAVAPRRAVATVAPTTPATTEARSPIAGSALSPTTWTSALDVLRERTTRR